MICKFKRFRCNSTNIVITLFVASFLINGCATTLPLKGRTDLLNFLADGKTTRTEIITTLGPPSGRFEKDKILTYRLGFESKNNGYYVVEREVIPDANWPTWLLAKYSLVLCFDNTGVLLKHSLVEVN